MSPYAVEHNLLPHLKNIHSELHVHVSLPEEGPVPDLLTKRERQLLLQMERLTSWDQMGVGLNHSLAMDVGHCSRAPFTHWNIIGLMNDVEHRVITQG